MKLYFSCRLLTRKELAGYESLLRQLSAKQRQRISNYTIQSFLIARWGSSLRGYPWTEKEKKRLVLLGAITPLFDDLMDTLKMPADEVLKNAFHSSAHPDPAFELIRIWYSFLMDTGTEEFKRICKGTLHAQDKSLAQRGAAPLDVETLKQITRYKGGNSTLLYRVVLDNPLVSGEGAAWEGLGYSFQLMNDAFDIYKDHEAGQQTLATRLTNMNELRDEWSSAIEQALLAFVKLDYPLENVKNVLREMAVLHGRGYVCLQQLCRLQKTNQAFDVSQFSRAQLICDMEQASNIIESMRYTRNFCGRVNSLSAQ